MKFGITDTEKYELAKIKRAEHYKKLIPHKVFLWLPKRVRKIRPGSGFWAEYGQYVWLEFAWKVCCFDSSGNISEVAFLETKEEALRYSKAKHNPYPSMSADDEYINCVRNGLYTSENH